MMILRTLAIMLALATLTTPPLQSGLWDNMTTHFNKGLERQTPAIRVLIGIDKESLEVEVDGPFKGYDPRTGEMLVLNKIGKKTTMRLLDAGFKWGEEFPGTHQLLIVPTDKSTRILVDGKRYPGSLYFYDVEGKISIVNKVNLEEYLTSILTPVHHKREPEEYLAALAITARTNAYYLAENPPNPYWAVNGDQVGYHGVVDISSSPAINQAIVETRHMVLSKTGAYEGMITPIYGSWKSEQNSPEKLSHAVLSKISLNEAKAMADAGSNAAQILLKAFPDTSVQLTYHIR